MIITEAQKLITLKTLKIYRYKYDLKMPLKWLKNEK